MKPYPDNTRHCQNRPSLILHPLFGIIFTSLFRDWPICWWRTSAASCHQIRSLPDFTSTSTTNLNLEIWAEHTRRLKSKRLKVIVVDQTSILGSFKSLCHVDGAWWQEGTLNGIWVANRLERLMYLRLQVCLPNFQDVYYRYRMQNQVAICMVPLYSGNRTPSLVHQSGNILRGNAVGVPYTYTAPSTNISSSWKRSWSTISWSMPAWIWQVDWI